MTFKQVSLDHDKQNYALDKYEIIDDCAIFIIDLLYDILYEYNNILKKQFIVICISR